MGAAFGLATALSRSAPPVPDVVPGRVDPAQALTGYAAPARPLRAGDWLTLWRSGLAVADRRRRRSSASTSPASSG